MKTDDERVPAWRRYLRFWKSSPADDVRDELEFHIQATIDELVADGLSPAAARARAQENFGDVKRIAATLDTLSRQRERTMARAEWWDTIKQDVVFGLRQLRRSPAFTIVAVSTLALGIGANSAIFSVVYSVLLRPLPFANADRILALGQRDGSNAVCCLPFGNYAAWRDRTAGFAEIGATWGGSSVLTGTGDPLTVGMVPASASYFRAMFIPPTLGRYYTDAEDRVGAPRVVVLSYALWQNRFNGDRGVVGRSITLSGNPYQVVGVASPDYILAPPAERVWVPLAIPAQRLSDFSDHELRVYGLLKPGVASAAALRQLASIEAEIARQNPHSGYDGGVSAVSIVESITGPHRETLYILLGAVVLVLLIACGNIANLLLARASARSAEIAVRGALGATRGRIVSQMLVESLLLALAGGVFGVGVAALVMRFLRASPVQMPRLQSASLNGSVLVFTVLVTLVCALLFGLVPALRAARTDLQQTLRDGGRDGRGGRDGLRKALVVSELVIAQVLLIGAGLLIRSSFAVRSVPIGFDTHNLVAFGLELPHSRYPEAARLSATFQSIDAALAAIPGVRGVGRTQVAPIQGFGYDWTAFREGSNGHDAGATGANMRFVTPTYFSTLGLSLLRGRAFSAADDAQGAKTAIVSRGLAKTLFGDVDPLGRRISNGGGERPVWMEIVGVVSDMRASGQKRDIPNELYMPASSVPNGAQTFLVRSNVPTSQLVPAIRRAVKAVDPQLAMAGVTTMDAAIDKQLATDTFSRWLLTALGFTGLLLAAIGVYGVIAYGVSQRSHEFGVRMALGASANGVQWLVVRGALALAAVSVVCGVGISLLAAKLLTSMVFGISARDPLTFVVVTGVLAIVAVGASYLPARRATRIDPLEALRGT
ncbi:MAG: ABC transporter permease [Gemmatimonadaceae bacterium]